MRVLTNLQDKLRMWNRSRIERLRVKRETESGHDFILGVLGIMKNESINLDEWVQHYVSMGAGKIFLIDNGSTDDTVSKAQAWVTKGVVELVEYPKCHRQRQHYWTAFKRLKIARKCQWLLVADLDEFWFCPSGETIAAQLPLFHKFDVIYANWLMFGSSGLKQHPASIRQGFTMRAPKLHPHSVHKYLCRTSVVKSAQTLGLHNVYGARSERTVSDNERFHLNHYPIQSLEFFQTVKMTRGSAAKSANDTVRHMQYFENHDAPCTTSDRLLADLVASGKIK
ncbi:MAG: glycosyltransferase family 2 protein [Cypionkella sp.]|nr:glycosyltransferase family 2 protein [Cypionkella sp.]